MPGTSPVLGFTGATPGQLTITYRDQNGGPKSRAKPAGVSALELYILFGAIAPASAAATPFYGLVTKSPFAVNCPSGSACQTAFMYGRWINSKGQPGPMVRDVVDLGRITDPPIPCVWLSPAIPSTVSPGSFSPRRSFSNGDPP